MAHVSPALGSLGSSFEGLNGNSPVMQALFRIIVRVANGRYPVLIVGESGTGKELVAQAIHSYGGGGHKPFVPVDCTAITLALAESELFGHAKGAFTGADASRKGLIEAANGGTLFLDEIGELLPALQVKFLRTLQEKAVRQVGSTITIPVAFRLLAATNRNLKLEAEAQRFRQDLFFRLNVVCIEIPPLRNHRDDIPLLANHFLNELQRDGSIVEAISSDALNALSSYDWPGNVRELENVIVCACALASSSRIEVRDLPHREMPRPDAANPLSLNLGRVMPLSELKNRAVARAMSESNGNKDAAARLLGIGRTTLYRTLKTLRAG
jgi:two-component system response regulator HydG